MTTDNWRSLPLTGGDVSFGGAVSLKVTDEGVHPYRLNLDQLDLFEEGVQLRAADLSAVRLAMISDASSLRMRYLTTQGADRPFDLLVDGVFHQRAKVETANGEVAFHDLPEGEHRLELYPYHRAPLTVTSLEVNKDATVRPFVDDRPRWLVYGSSITQAKTAEGPSEVWPAAVANALGLNVTSLGYGGNCVMEPMVTRMIRDLPADYISMCLGINTYSGSLSARTFRAAVLGTIVTARDGHPDTPMVVVSPIMSPPRENEPGPCGLSLVMMRELVLEAVSLLQARGDKNLHYVDGLELFGPEQVQYLPDKLHPSGEGYRVLAQRYQQVVMPLFGLTSAVNA